MSEFAKLARKDEPIPAQVPAVEPLEADSPPEAPEAPEAPEVVARGTGPLLSRTNTLEDPMTTQLLAAVARSKETMDFEDDVAEDPAATSPPGETTHPHTRRRTR